MTTPRWDSVRGSITREGEFTEFRLQVRGSSGRLVAQRIDVETERLSSHPEVYARVLGMMVREIEARL